MNDTDIQQWLIQHVADYLNLPATDIDPAARLQSYSLDSLYSLTLGADIYDTFGLMVEPTFVWGHPTVDMLAEHLTTLASDRH